jgi:glutamine amidotransferase
MLLTVVDYGVGNLRSIAKSIEKANSDNNLNYTIKVSANANDVRKSDKIVLPGQGSFKACKNGIKNIEG